MIFSSHELIIFCDFSSSLFFAEKDHQGQLCSFEQMDELVSVRSEAMLAIVDLQVLAFSGINVGKYRMMVLGFCFITFSIL